MSKSLKVVLGVIFIFIALIYMVNIGAKSFDDANSTGRLISHLVIGILLGGTVAMGLLQAESQQHIAANKWVAAKLNTQYNAIFIAGIVSLLSVVISKSAFEVTKSSWYIANEISSNGVAICDEYESAAQVEKSYDKLITLAKAHFSGTEIFLMACNAAVSESNESEPYTLKVALTYVENDNPSEASSLLVMLNERSSQEQVIVKLARYGYLDTAAEAAISLDDKKLVFLASKYEMKQQGTFSTLASYLANSANTSTLDELKVYIEFFEYLGNYSLIVDTYKAFAEDSGIDDETLSYASLELGKLYYFSPYINSDIDNAQTLFKRAAEHGSEEAKYYLARIYLYERNDRPEALKVVEELHKAGNVSGTYLLGKMTFNGWGVEKNEAYGIELIQLAAQQGSTHAFAQLGWHYMNGVGVEQNYEVAKEFLEKAVSSDGLEAKYAQFNLGWMYYNGLGVSKDYQKAMTWFKRSEARGFKDASSMLGKIYEEGGYGLNKDIELALNYYRESDKNWGDVSRLDTLIEKEKIEDGKGYVEQGAFFCPDTQSAMRAKALDNASDYNPYAKAKISDYCIFNTRGKFYLKQVTAINSDFVYFQDLGRQFVALRRSVKLDES
ncbi:hypothetical protein KUL42_06080 [Alteromonas sp. KUL42]|uniref:tetratricopeptide repeat protein n=1 Tax=Alteromonas sp. KUL42 TaxID=2480797 RepID=UPI001035BFDD|nr:tetratricopeptide repeat protein [Alteromonas sp. KUL42]TAP37443.1 sel1 repeat family protein [Alteromonas sp. KUL42]GEA05847.1 hypothetical protein KUL42_06080 [Alteromonas sp. KUL42]